MEKTLLLVDDEQNILRSLKRSLYRCGFTILTAQSGEEGLNTLSDNDVGVIISDQRMPGMNGTEFLSRAKRLYPDTLRMMLSGYTELKSVTEAINQGEVYKFLTKPWEDEVLQSVVVEAFELYELRLENRRLNSELAAMNSELELRVEQRTREFLLSYRSLQIAQDLLERLPVGVIGVDCEGMIVSANQMVRDFLNHSRGVIVGAQIRKLIPSIRFPQAEIENIAEFNLVSEVEINGGYFSVYCNTLNNENEIRGYVFVIIENKGNL